MKTYMDFRELIDSHMADLDVMRAILEAYNQMLDVVEQELDAEDFDDMPMFEGLGPVERPAA